MDYSIKNLGPMLIMGIEVRTTNEDWQVAKDLPPFWGKFWGENIKAKIPGKTSEDAIGLYCEYEKDHTKPYTLVAGCAVEKVAEIPSGLVLKKVPASKYAVFEIKGEFPAALMEVWQWVWEGHLRRTYTGDLEVYPDGWHAVDNPNMQLFIAIQ